MVDQFNSMIKSVFEIINCFEALTKNHSFLLTSFKCSFFKTRFAFKSSDKLIAVNLLSLQFFLMY